MRRTFAVLLGISTLIAGGLTSTAGARTRSWAPPAETNKDLPPGLTPYHEIAPRLRALDRSDRVQVTILGRSAQGRNLYLVTVSEPSSFGRFGRYMALRDLMLRDPAAAQERIDEFDDFKVPFFVNASIHGNEWEGVDASLDLIEKLAFSNDSETRKILANNIVMFNVVQNPDGRVLGQRQNANGFDLNRDFITLSQPEPTLAQRVIAAWNPMVLLDLHGYVGPGGLIEPATPPHNPNYEYDLYIEWAYDQAKAMADGARAETGLEPWIPYRDFAPGDWDDWPPIFTPMYAMYHGSYGHTLESPLRVNNSAVDLPAAERRRRADVNRRWHYASMWSALRFTSANRKEMVRDQIEIFRRGKAGDPQVPRPFGGEYGPEDEYIASFPEGFVIPVGDGQRSESAAVRLVNHLLVNDVEVLRATGAFAAAGRAYPAGSYVVDLEQPKRGLANTILEPGFDISDRVPQMYDISGWSHALLWGATVDTVPRDTPLEVSGAHVVAPQSAAGGVEGGRAAAYALDLDDPAGIRAVNHLLDLDVEVGRGPDGRVVFPASAKPHLQRAASTYGLWFEALAIAPSGTSPIDDPRIAAAIPNDEAFVLDHLGFDFRRVSRSDLNAGLDLSGFDVLLVSSGLTYSGLNPAAQAEVTEFLTDGGLVTRGSTGARFNDAADVLTADFRQGPACSIANGIVEVDHSPTSPVTAGYPARDTSFVYDPLWFTDLGAEARVAERYGSGDFFVAGHWLGDDESGANSCGGARADSGQDDAAGQPAIVSGISDEGTRVVLFGTEPMFRDHPKGLYVQVANALYWAASDAG